MQRVYVLSHECPCFNLSVNENIPPSCEVISGHVHVFVAAEDGLSEYIVFVVVHFAITGCINHTAAGIHVFTANRIGIISARAKVSVCIIVTDRHKVVDGKSCCIKLVFLVVL